MRIEYIREMKRSYMTVTGEGVGESYETGMLAKNQISGLLKMKIKYWIIHVLQIGTKKKHLYADSKETVLLQTAR